MAQCKDYYFLLKIIIGWESKLLMENFKDFIITLPIVTDFSQKRKWIELL